MRRIRFQRPSKPTIFTMLMIASLVMLALPDSLLHSVKSLAQTVAAPPQLAAYRATQATGEAVNRLAAKPVDARLHDH